MAERTDLATKLCATSESTERSAAQIRQNIAEKRESISQTVDELERRIHQTLDWREYLAAHPFVALGVAAGVGFLVSGLLKSKPSPRERIIDALAETVEDITEQFRDAVGQARRRNRGVGRTAMAAAAGALTELAVSLLKSQAGRVKPKANGA
jgi:ElaB/YqjD/DUF883 family membrane-anchored ribosome-binding protein